MIYYSDTILPLRFFGWILIFFLYPSFVEAGVVSIILPNGGECLTVGQAYTITINDGGNDHTSLYYRTDGQQPAHLDSSEIKHPLQFTTWSWTPTNAHISETGRIWVEGHFNNHNSAGVWDNSDANFSIRSSCASPPPPPPPPPPSPPPSSSPSPASGGGALRTPPPFAQAVEIINIFSDKVTVIWTTDRPSYSQIQYGTVSGQEILTTDIQQTLQLQHLLVLDSLSASTTYYFKITSGSSLEEKNISEEFSFTTLIQPPPPDVTPPGQVLNVFGLAGASTTLLTWTNPSDPDFLEVVIVSKISEFPKNREDGDIVFRSTEQQYRDAGLMNGTTYYYAIFTLDKDHNTSKSVEISLTPAAPLPEVPTLPSTTTLYLASSTIAIGTTTPLRIRFPSSEPNEGAIMLRWKNPQSENFLGVHIVRNTEALPGNPHDGAVVFRGRLEEFKDTGLIPGKRYFYGIFLIDWKNNFLTGSFIAENAGALSPFMTLGAGVKEFQGAFATSSRRALSIGSTGEEVRSLQKFLAADPALYPERIITGYFGHLTEKAIQRFQTKYQIVSFGSAISTGYGAFGPRTKAKIIGLLQEAEKIGMVFLEEAKPQRKIFIVFVDTDEFSPAVLNIAEGDIARWVNNGAIPVWPASDDHPTHLQYLGFDALRVISQGDSYSFIFQKKGVWEYHDHLNPVRTGKIIVE